MSLRTRIAAVAAFAAAVAIVCGAVGAFVGIRAQLRGQVDDALRARVQLFEADRSRPGENAFDGGFGDPQEQSPSSFGGAEGFVQRVSPAGVVTDTAAGATTQLPVRSDALAIARTGTGEHLTDMLVDGVHVRVLTQGIGRAGALQVARPMDEVDRSLVRVLQILALMTLGGIVMAATLGLVVARTALTPITRFTRRTEVLTAAPDLSQRIDIDSDDELAGLARSFNAARDALERSVEAQRHLVADASHELRTPIASLRANIQVLQDASELAETERVSMRKDIVDELDQLTALISDVVELARGTNADEVLDEVRLDQIADVVVQRARRRAGDSLNFALRLEPTLVLGEPERISRAISNLLENARKWSPHGGVVEVVLAGGVLSVRDHGLGFESDDLPHVFERFYRADGARAIAGSGLGLAIVRQTAEAHGGSVSAANAPDGGAVLQVRFGSPLEFAAGLTDAEAVSYETPTPSQGNP